MASKHIYEFGEFRIDADERLLLRDGKPVPLTPKAFDTLLLLVENSGHLVKKDDLMNRVWPDSYVEEVNLAQNVSAIRKALNGQGEQYIETVPKRGYRLIVKTRIIGTADPSAIEVQASAAEAAQTDFNPAALPSSAVQPAADLAQIQQSSRKWRWWYGAIAAAIVVGAGLIIFQLRTRSSIVPPSDWGQITSFADSVTSPAFSPDGRMLAFLRGDNTFTTAGQVYVMLLPHGNPVRLTNDATAKMSPIFSPDGNNVAYTVPWNTWSVPVLGGEPRLWLPNASGLTWINAENLLFSQITNGNHMQMEVVHSDLSRGHLRAIYAPISPGGMAHRSYASPDHKWVIAVEMAGNFWKRCRLVPFDGSSPGVLIGPEDGVCTAAAWSADGKWMYLNTNSGDALHIWRQQFPSGRIEQVTSGPTEEEGIALDPDGKSIITAVGIRRTSVWLHDGQGDRMVTSEAAAALADPRNGSAFSPDGRRLYYLLRRPAGSEVNTNFSIGELYELDLQSGATKAAMPGFSIADFSFSPDGRDIVFSALNEEMGTSADNLNQSIWLAPLDRSSSPRLLQANASRARFAPGFIYYRKRSPGGWYLHRIRTDGSGDEQIWPENIVSAATSPDGRYLAMAVPIRERMWKLQIVDWARKRVQPVCNDAIAYWSDDGKSFVISGGFGLHNPSYVVDLSVPNTVPELPPNGLSSVEQFANLKNVRVVPSTGISLSRGSDTYAYVKESVQRNLYRIPLR